MGRNSAAWLGCLGASLPHQGRRRGVQQWRSFLGSHERKLGYSERPAAPTALGARPELTPMMPMTVVRANISAMPFWAAV